MKDTIELPPGRLHSLISEYIGMHSDEISRFIIDSLFVEAVAINSARNNDGASISLSIDIPSSEECLRIIESGDFRSARCPGI